MPELRKDYILDRYVIIAADRGKRPHQLVDSAKAAAKKCFFCPGSEHETPPEIYRVAEDENWRIRVFDNKFPAVSGDGNAIIQTDNDFYTFADAIGKHEVIVETESHDKQLWDLSASQIADVIEVYKLRQEEIALIPEVKYVSVFKNSGEQAGCSIAHTHSQIIAYNLVPPIIQQKEKKTAEYDTCPYCDILAKEAESARMIYKDEHVMAFSPYASRFPYEVWIFPIKHMKSFNELSKETIDSMAIALNKVLTKLKELDAPYNYYFHYGDFHLHMEICPRFSKVKWAGFELSTETIINPVSPEIAAEWYKS